MNEYFVFNTVRFSVAYIPLRVNFLDWIYVRIVSDFSCSGLLARACFDIEPYRRTVK